MSPAGRSAVALAAWLLGGMALAGPDAPRLAPPATLACPRNELTSYTGLVRSWRREGAMVLHLGTDWGTDEVVTLPTGDPTPHFRLHGAAFQAADWALIESAPGHPVAGLRATAWVCASAGIPPVIDWQPPPTR